MHEFAADPPVEERVGDLLREAEATVAAAESCTGGLIGSLLTDVPGASDYFDRSSVTYTYDAKLDTGVSREALDEYGAVSAPVAKQMAQGVRDAGGTDWAVSTTGIAGPTGGTPDKPVGTVFIGVAHAGDWGTGATYAAAHRRTFDGSRTEIKEQIARAALRALETAVSRKV
ncbi:MAG: CinA family protein [Halobacteriaceae archaeon]